MSSNEPHEDLYAGYVNNPFLAFGVPVNRLAPRNRRRRLPVVI